MDLDFDKYCLVEGSPTTVLPAPRCHSNVANRKSNRKPRYINEIPRISEDLEINFSQSQRVSQEGNEVLKRGSIYHSSREVCLLQKTDTSIERKKIELSLRTKSAPNLGIIDSLCISDEDSFLEKENKSSLMSLCEQSTSSKYENQVDFCSYEDQEKDLPAKLQEPLPVKFTLPHSPTKSRFSPVKKMWDPFVRSKSQRSPLSSFSGISPTHLCGILKLGTKNGAPFFHFSVKSLEDVYMAKSWKAENASNWVYTFHSLPYRRIRNTSGWGFKESSRESSMVGQMHVSCSQCTEFKSAGESEDFMVTEFVLYDIIHSSCSSDASQPLELTKLHPGLEIAAIVMQAPLEKRESLKLKSGDRKVDLFQPRKAKEGSLDILSPGKTIVIPAGNHGSPVTESHGPSSLLDRWRLGGGCDCGGWDMACPLSVFSNSTVKITDGQPLIDNQNPTELFVQVLSQFYARLTFGNHL